MVTCAATAVAARAFESHRRWGRGIRVVHILDQRIRVKADLTVVHVASWGNAAGGSNATLLESDIESIELEEVTDAECDHEFAAPNVRVTLEVEFPVLAAESPDGAPFR